MATATTTRYTPEEYIALERKAEFRHEYTDGEIRPMAGTSRNHNISLLNLGSEIRAGIGRGSAAVFVLDMRVRIEPSGRYSYPDVVAVAEKPQFDDSELDTLLNPAVVIEILSPSTEADDRGDNFARYRRLPSLREYVLVDQDRVHIEHYARRDVQWVLSEMDGPDATLHPDSIGCAIPLREVYDRTTVA